MAKKKYFIIGTIALLLILVFVFFTSGNEIKSYELKKSDFKETLSASGRVEAKNRIDMIFQKAGRIENITAVEGQFYNQGDQLLILEKAEEENEVDSKNLLLRTAQNNFKDVENQYKIKALNYEALKTNYENLKLMYERNLKLFEAGGISQKELEDLDLQIKEAETKRKVAEVEYLNYSSGGSLRESALIDIENAKIQLEKALIERNKKIITAPFYGQVLSITKEKFSTVQAGEIGIVFAEENSYIITDIDERDYQKVQPGQRAFIQFLNSSEMVEGVVRDVSPVIDRTKGTIKVRIDFLEESNLKTDIGVNVEILVNEYKNKIIIPSEFVFSNPRRIIINENNIAKVILLKNIQATEGYYIVLDPEFDEYLGKNIVGVNFDDGEKIK